MMRIITTIALLTCCLDVTAADWPQFRGPDQSGVSKETGLLKAWPKGGPELVWTFKDAGTGYSGPAIVGGKVYLMGAREGSEWLIALNADGKEAWATKLGPLFDFEGNAWSGGPNGTPTVVGDRIYAMGSQGILICTDLKGTEQWRKSMTADLGGGVNPIGGGDEKFGWGYSWSPVVVGDLVICQPGGAKGLMAALKVKDGSLAWQTKDITLLSTYSTAVTAEIGKVKQVVQVTQEGALGVEAATGKVLWQFKRDNAYTDVVCPSPIVHDGHVYITVGFGNGSDLIKVTEKDGKFTVTPVYNNEFIGSDTGGVVLVDKHVFGTQGHDFWACQDFLTGKIAWDTRRNNKALKAGSVLAADGKLFCLEERDGIVGLLEATPKQYTEISRFELPRKSTFRTKKTNAKLWTHPVLSDGLLYLRDHEFVFCYKVK